MSEQQRNTDHNTDHDLLNHNLSSGADPEVLQAYLDFLTFKSNPVGGLSSQHKVYDGMAPKESRTLHVPMEGCKTLIDGIKDFLNNRIEKSGDKSAVKFYSLMLRSIVDGENSASLDKNGMPPTAEHRAEEGLHSLMNMLSKLDRNILTIPLHPNKSPDVSLIGTFDISAVAGFGFSPAQIKALTDTYLGEKTPLTQHLVNPSAPRRIFAKGLVATLAAAALPPAGAYAYSENVPLSTDQDIIVKRANQKRQELEEQWLSSAKDKKVAQEELEAARDNLAASLDPAKFEELSYAQKRALEIWREEWQKDKDSRARDIFAERIFPWVAAAVLDGIIVLIGAAVSVDAASNVTGADHRNRNKVVKEYSNLVSALDALAGKYSTIITPLTNELAVRIQQHGGEQSRG